MDVLLGLLKKLYRTLNHSSVLQQYFEVRKWYISLSDSASLLRLNKPFLWYKAFYVMVRSESEDSFEFRWMTFAVPLQVSDILELMKKELNGVVNIRKL